MLLFRDILSGVGDESPMCEIQLILLGDEWVVRHIQTVARFPAGLCHRDSSWVALLEEFLKPIWLNYLEQIIDFDSVYQHPGEHGKFLGQRHTETTATWSFRVIVLYLLLLLSHFPHAQWSKEFLAMTIKQTPNFCHLLCVLECWANK